MNTRELLAAATSRPWASDEFSYAIGAVGDNPEGEWSSTVVHEVIDPDDAELIVAAVNEYEAHLDGEDLLRGLLDHFRGYDEERTDGRTSPVIPKIEDVLARLDASRPS